jgi:hypothetical protein
MFNCRDLDGGLSVLHKDYSIKCSTDRHAAFELIAAAYVACVSLGIPLYMVRSTKNLQALTRRLIVHHAGRCSSWCGG